jgi:pyruvate/2-oxoglutarate/acetoin dehydrogenase E1 component
MALLTYIEAISSAICGEMGRNPRLLVMGQDVEWSMRDAVAKGDIAADRLRSTPISEAGFIGAGIGAALTGMHPIIVLGCSTFLYSAMDQVVNQAAKSRYMFGGQAHVPLVIRAPIFYSIGGAAHHSDRPWGLFAQAPGLKIIVPATPYDAKGLLVSALRDGNPVLCFEDVTVWDQRGEVPEEDYTVPIGVADIKHSGSDVTVVAVAGAVQHSLAAARMLGGEGISVEVIDIRTVVPLDRRTILDSVEKTRRLIVVDPAPGTCGVAAEVAALAAEHVFEHLCAPVIRLTAPDVPVPFSPQLERLMFPTADSIAEAARRQCLQRQESKTS